MSVPYDKPREWTGNQGTWFWLHGAVMLIWSYLLAQDAGSAWQAGAVGLAVGLGALTALGLVLLLGWMLIRNRLPGRGDPIWRLPELVVGLYDLFCFGGGVVLAHLYQLNYEPVTKRPPVVVWLLAAFMVWVGSSLIKRARARHRWLNRPDKPETPAGGDSP